MYIIYGKYNGEVEEIDEADDLKTAQYLVGEYRLAFGADWKIWHQRKRGTR
jgi:hypothetical protein